jgi:hypothetical protein
MMRGFSRRACLCAGTAGSVTLKSARPRAFSNVITKSYVAYGGFRLAVAAKLFHLDLSS